MTATVRRSVARIRGPMLPIGVALIVAAVLVDFGALAPVGIGLIVIGIGLLFVPTEQPEATPVTVTMPVAGRWVAVNSPADKVPSHSTRELGQAYAIDLVHVPDPATPWQPMRRWPPAQPAHAFPGFGQPITSPLPGTVIKTSGWQRDHWSRNSPPALAYLLPEMLVRAVFSLFNGQFILGNHVVIDCGNGIYAAFAHLQRGSIRVRRGQDVQAGDQLADCGNSGNTSEPHLHFQLMDHRRPVLAAGVRFTFARYLVEDQAHSGVPRNQQPFTTG